MQDKTEENVQGTEENVEDIKNTEETAQNTAGEELAVADVEQTVADVEQTVAVAELSIASPEPTDGVEKKKFDITKITVPMRSKGKQIWQHTKRLTKAGFRRLHKIYCRNICTYSNILLIAAAILLCLTGAFSQAVFGILVVLHLFLSVHADRKEKKRIAAALLPEQSQESSKVQEEEALKEATLEEWEPKKEEPEEEEVTIKARKSRLEQSLDSYGRRIGAVMLVLSLTLFVQSFMFRYESFRTGALSMCCAFVAAMPIGLYVLKWLADYIGSVRISKKGMKVQEKRSVERLSEMDVLLITHSSFLAESCGMSGSVAENVSDDTSGSVAENVSDDTSGSVAGSVFDAKADGTAFANLRERGVRTILISEETPENLSAVMSTTKMSTTEMSVEASLVGMQNAGDKGSGEILDAATLHNMDEMRKAVLRGNVIGNATPFQKGVFVNLLQESGKVVTVVGRSEEDATAIREADVSVVFAKKEEKVARLSDMVSENGGPDTLLAAYEESSIVCGNLQKLSSLFFMKNICALLLAVYAAVCSVSYPVTLSMWLLVSTFTIGIPAVVLLFCEKKERSEKFLLDSVKGSVLTALTGVISMLVLLYYGNAFGLDAKQAITAGVLLLAVAGFLRLGEYCLPCNMLQILLIAVCIVGFLICFVFLKPVFELVTMGHKMCLLLILFLIAEETIYRFFRFVRRKIAENLKLAMP